mgnify:CR=1 FL=1
MNSYDVRATTVDGHVLEFNISAKDDKQADKFAKATAVQICKNRGISSKINGVDVDKH